MKRTAIVILNWNGEQLLDCFLPSVLDNTPSEVADVIVADNNSTDNSIQLLETKYPQVRVIRLAENYGYAGGYNKALEQVKADYFLLLNSDVEVTQGWIEPLIECLDKHADVVAVQPKIKAYRNKSLFEYAGAAGGFIDRLGYPFCRGRIFGTVEEDRGQYDTAHDVFWTSGACMLIRSKDFFEAGGFDASFFAHMEEIDLCWRLNARDRRLCCLPQSVVYHIGGATLDEESPRKTYLNFRNNLLMLYKNLPEESFKKVLRERHLYDWLAALRFVLSGKFGQVKAIRKARKDFNKMKAEYAAVRSQNLSLTTCATINTIYPRNLIKEYYLSGRKLFSQLTGF
ncbi:glycosyltransferase family 2 protein [Dysgonomonas sp. 25]|uniref:glycosyltransferase family 2 protein n=1 Tax=Dysgonomonas sp. 25 TaxID=2302933 RepID=UPI0013D574DF|nr:glycosyltransferase family 2 protein [Dysgonomonas sp. 25]NDV69616.1 glycosyltransferase family 2 protein [Dysgonomonas sp. 25]